MKSFSEQGKRKISREKGDEESEMARR